MNCRYILMTIALLVLCVATPVQSRDLIVESFEGEFFPPGWANITTGEAYTWLQSDQYAHGGRYCTWLYGSSQGDEQDEWLITPAIDASGLSSLQIEWWETSRSWNVNQGHHHYVMVSTTSQTDPGTFEVVSDMIPQTHPIPYTPEWQKVVVDLSQYAGEETVYVALRYTNVGDNADWWYVDDVWIRQVEEHDISVISTSPLGQDLVNGETLTPAAVFWNLGMHPETFQVSLTISESGTQVYTETAQVTDLAPGETAAVSFPDFQATSGNYIEIVGAAHLATDTDPHNDARTAYNYAYTGPRVPLGLFATNWGCGPCVAANQALDAFLPGQGNEVSVMRVHGWWPEYTDPMYQANVDQCRALILGTPTGNDYVPHLWLDGTHDAGSDVPSYADSFEARKLVGAAATLDLVFNPDLEQVQATVSVTEPLVPAGDYMLRVAVTEDDVHAPGPNGEEYHNQVFRYMYPDMNGVNLSTAFGEQTIVIDTPLDETWVFANLRATAYVEEQNSGRVVNSATLFLDESVSAAGDTPAISQSQLLGAQPNPFNPQTLVHYSVDRIAMVAIDVYDLQGRRVRNLIQEWHQPGEHAVTWDGTDFSGRSLPSGIYFVRLRADGVSEEVKVTLLK